MDDWIPATRRLKIAIRYVALAHRIRLDLGRGDSDLADQLRRASQSIAQNIAEGAGRVSRGDKAKYYAIARGSAMECAAHLDVMQIDP